VPGHKTLSRLAAAGWTVSTAVLIIEMITGTELRPLFPFLLSIAVTATAVAAVKYLQATAITPVREAFLHGYQLATQHAAAVQAAKADANLARVLRPPAGAWTVNETPYAVDQRGPRHRAPSPRQSR
jgi:hypothetical protein